MPRSQSIEKPKQQKQIIVQNNRTPSPVEMPEIPEGLNMPVRAVLYVEVYDMPTPNVQLLVSEIGRRYSGAQGGTHYILPVRHGKIASDIYFESEWLNVVRETCEIKDGQICLKGGAQEVYVVRTTIN